MKDSKISTIAYVMEQFIDYGSLKEEDKQQIKKVFIKWYTTGKKLKWNNTTNKLPKSTHYCLCISGYEFPITQTRFRIGTYQNNNWHLQGSLGYPETVIKWIKL